MKYKIIQADGQICLLGGKNPTPLADWLKAHIANQTAVAAQAGIDRYSVNLVCGGVRELGHLKFFKILAAIGAVLEIPDAPPAPDVVDAAAVRAMIAAMPRRQTVIAQTAGLSRQAVNAFMHGKLDLMPATLQRLAAAVGKIRQI